MITEPPSTIRRPSFLYRANMWRIGIDLTRLLPQTVTRSLAKAGAATYANVAAKRRRVVVQNLLPILDNDRRAAEKTADDLFRNFAIKLLDLWRFEAGQPIEDLFTGLHGRDQFDAAINCGRGVLLLTPHLGNWEFGAPLMTINGYKLHVITLAEPGRGLTEMRQAARARWGIETLVIGRDPFAFIEIIRRLEAGATIALLVDRPPANSSVEVRLFGRPFLASVAVAELARATGCQLLPTYLVRERTGYATHILPPIPYERPSLRDRAARQALTQRVIDVFAPVIREHADQWYHFVPVFRDEAGGIRRDGRYEGSNE